MSAQISMNPFVTTNAAGSFGVTTTGGIQGTLAQNPTENFRIAGGILAATETLAMYGGIAITELIPTYQTGVPTVPAPALGGVIARATAVANITGWSIFDQNYAMVNTPQSPVPLSGSGGQVNFVRTGSGARLWVACDPALASIENGAINQNVSWDYNNQLLAPYDASTATIAASATVTWANTNGGQLTVPVANWTGAFQPVAGDILTISGATNSGTGGAAAINKSFVVVSATATQAVFAAPAAAGVFGTIGGSPVINFGTGIAPCKVLGFNFGNSMTVQYDASTGFATWNRSGTAALILI